MNEVNKSQKIDLNISVGTMFKVAVFILAAFLLYRLSGLVVIILASVVIASVIEPIVRFLIRRRVQRLFAATISYLSIVAIVIGIFTYVLPPLFSQSVSAINGLPKYVKTIDILKPLDKETISGIRTFFPELPNNIAVGDLGSMLTNLVSNFSGGFFFFFSGFFGGVAGLVIMVVIAFYLSVREDGVGEFLAVVTPLKHEKYVRNLWLRSQHKIGKWMQGQIILALSVGILTYIALLIVGVPHPFLLAFLAGIFEFIPIIGVTFSMIPAFFLSTLTGGFGLGLIVIAIYIFIQQIESHVLYPIVAKKIIGVPPLLVIISLIAGAQLAGLLGALLAVPISVALLEFINDIEEKKRFK